MRQTLSAGPVSTTRATPCLFVMCASGRRSWRRRVEDDEVLRRAGGGALLVYVPSAEWFSRAAHRRSGSVCPR